MVDAKVLSRCFAHENSNSAKKISSLLFSFAVAAHYYKKTIMDIIILQLQKSEQNVSLYNTFDLLKDNLLKIKMFSHPKSFARTYPCTTMYCKPLPHVPLATNKSKIRQLMQSVKGPKIFHSFF